MKIQAFKHLIAYWGYYVLFLCCFQKAYAQEKISLKTAISRTLEHNITIKEAKVTELLAAEDLKQAQNNRLPVINTNPQASYNFGRSPNLATYSYTNQSFLYVNGAANFNVTLFQGGQLRKQIMQNKIMIDVSKSTTDKIKNDLVLNVMTDFLQILTNQDLVDAAKQQIEIANQTLSRSQIKLREGNQTFADVSEAQAQVSVAKFNLTYAQNQLDMSVLILKQYMEMDSNAAIVIEKPDSTKFSSVQTLFNADELMKSALSLNPDVILAEQQKRGYAQAVQVSRSAFLPVLSLFGALGSNYSNSQTQKVIGSIQTLTTIGTVQGSGLPVLAPSSLPILGPYTFGNQIGNNFNQSIGLSLQIPLLNKYSAHTNVRRAELNYESSKLNYELVKSNLRKTIIQAIYDIQAAENQYQSALETFRASKDALKIIQRRYEVGLVNLLDFNTAVLGFNKAQNNMIEAKYNVIFRSKIIDFYTGAPLTLE